MPRAQPLQSSFAFGELSPRLLGRSDTERYRQSLRICENVITLSHGNALKRPGTEYLAKSPTEGNIKLIDLQADPLLPLVVELGWRVASGGYLRVLDRTGYVNGAPIYVKNPQFFDGLTDWIDGSTAPAFIEWVAPEYVQMHPSGGPVTYTHPWNYAAANGNPVSGGINHQNAGGGLSMIVHYNDANAIDRSAELLVMTIGDTIVAFGQTWTITSTAFAAPYATYGITPNTQLPAATYNFDLNTTLAFVNPRLQQEITVPNPANSHTVAVWMLATGASPVAQLNIGTTQGASDILLLPLDTGENISTFTPVVGTFWISIEVNAPTRVGFDTYVDAVAITEGAPGTYEVATPWSNEDLLRMTTAESTQQVALYFTTDNQPPQRLVVVVPGVFNFEPVPFSTAPAAWMAGNYPHAVTIYQQRIWYASTPNEPDTLWGSVTGDFLNFALGTGTPTDAIEFEMSDRGVIEWIQGARDLLIGADVAEYVLTSTGGVIIPGDVQVQQQSAYGSTHQEAVEVGNGVLYLGADSRRIRFMNYQFLEDGWVSLDLTWPSEHVTAALVRELHFKYAPDPLIWCVLEDGTTISAIYEREQDNLVGWHRHPFPLGDVQSLALTKLGAATELWVAVQRDIGGSEVTYIEKTGALSLTPTSPELSVLSDSALITTVTGTEQAPVVVGLDHLEGVEVQLLVQGSVHPSRTVVGGQVSLQPNFAKLGNIVIAGIQFTGHMRTLPLEGLNQAGTSMATQMRRNRIFVRLLASAIPVVNGVVTGARFPITPMGETEPQFTGDILVADLGWDRFAEVDIEMPLPRVYNVLAIFGDAASEKL